jgi:hypothetical protein
MELTNRQRKWYNLGAEMAKEYADERQACYAMDDDILEDLAIGTWSNGAWFHAGFVGIEPEYVEAVRFGAIPEDGRSINHAERKYEDGVSCVKIIRSEADRNAKSIYDVTLGYQGIEKNIISGWYLGGSGSDGEPLLVDAK